MKDNLSIIILMIIFVVLVIMFPLYNFFERQDDMSYNLVLKATTNFVDEVLNNGYIDSDTYSNYILTLGNTGNIYDVELEAHVKTFTEDPDNPGKDIFITQYKIDYNQDILETISATLSSSTLETNFIKNNIYHLEIGDEFYVKLRNVNTTPAGALFNSIISTSSKERIVVNYGGVVKNTAWKSVDAEYGAKSEDLSYSTIQNNNSIAVVSTVNSTDAVVAYFSLIDISKKNVINSDGTIKIYDTNKWKAVDECNGTFVVVNTYYKLVHSCYLHIKDCADDKRVKVTCPASKQQEKVEVVSYERGDICPTCGNLTLNMKFKLKCTDCGYIVDYIYPYCVNCMANSYGLAKNYGSESELDLKQTIGNLKFILNTHSANLCNPDGENVNLYRKVKVYKCKECNAVYEEYEAYNEKCNNCKVTLKYNKEIKGEEKHNLILVNK